MARTQILPTDPGAVKQWETEVAVEMKKKSFFTKMTGTEKSAMPVIRKTSLESGLGDEVTMYLIAKMTGKPREGAEKIAGFEDKLNHFTDKLRIDKHRRAVNCGDIMDQKRVPFDIAEECKARLADYAAEVHDEQITMTVSGGRGAGDEIQHYPVGYAGFPNAFETPDDNHRLIWDGSVAYNALVSATHKLGTAVIDGAKLKAQKMIGDIKAGKAAKMVPCSADGGSHFLFMTGPEGMHDLRREVGDAGFLTLEKAKMTAEGGKNLIFTGGKAYHNGVLIDELQTIVKFNDAGAGSVNAMRSLFLGAHAVSVAYGTKGQSRATRYELTESDLDHGEEEVIVMRLIAGYKKSRFNGMDFGCISVDHTYKLAPGASI
ncbi:MAG: N4-gp56 family major capsid protein [Methylibium sp.]|nr:N4-gp56 family major capsid protein [Methylibium sp.]